MLSIFSTPRNRLLTWIFLSVCVAAGTAAALVGISDNPPGIALAYLSVCAFILAFIHPWRRVKQYWRLFYWSLPGFVVLVVAHNVFEVVAQRMASGWLEATLQVIQVTAFLLAVLVCPPSIVISVLGMIIFFILGRRLKPA